MFLAKINGHQIKLWQNPDGSWGADYGLDPMGFVFDDALPEDQRIYELDHLISHSSEPAKDLATQIINIDSDGKPDSQKIFSLTKTIEEKIKSGQINPSSFAIADALKLIQVQEVKTNPEPPVNVPTTPPPPPIAKKLIEKNLLEEIGLGNLELQERKELLEIFNQTVWQAIILRIADRLEKNEKEEFEAILTAYNEELLGLYLKSVPNLDMIVQEESLKFKKFMLDKARQTDKKIQYQQILHQAKVAI